MNIKILTLLFLICGKITSAQIGNDKKLIAENKVKSSFEKHCFSGSNSSCTEIWEEYDSRGNSLEWNMQRLGSIYRNVYDKKNNKIFTLWVNKKDSSKIDTIAYVYDKNNQLTQDGIDKFTNFYNSKKQLIKQLSESLNINKNIVRETRKIHWTNFGKIKTDITTTEIIEVNKKTKLDKLRVNRKEYLYDDYNKLNKETHF